MRGARYRPIKRAHTHTHTHTDSAGRVIKKRTLRQFSFSAPYPRRRQIGCIFKSPLCRAPPGFMSRVGSKINGAPLALMSARASAWTRTRPWNARPEEGGCLYS